MVAFKSADIAELVAEIGAMTIVRMGVTRMLGAEDSPSVRLHLDERVEQSSVTMGLAALRALDLGDQRSRSV
jgi:hypothetical protein